MRSEFIRHTEELQLKSAGSFGDACVSIQLSADDKANLFKIVLRGLL